MNSVECLNCGFEFELEKIHNDKLGYFTMCPNCESSFDLQSPQEKILEKYFKVYNNTDNTISLEQWTKGGVDMYIGDLNKDNIIEELEEYLDNFDIDEEIDMYRQGEDYKRAFTIRESVEDFESWVEYIENVIKELKEIE